MLNLDLGIPDYDVQDWLVPTIRRQKSVWLDKTILYGLRNDVSITGQLRNCFLDSPSISISAEPVKTLFRKIFSDESFVDFNAYLNAEIQTYLALLKIHPTITLTGRIDMLPDDALPIFRVAFIGEKDLLASRRPNRHLKI